MKKIHITVTSCIPYKKGTGLKNIWMLLVAIALSQTLMAQELKLGDPAPSLTPYEWIKGAPITKFEKGKVYVVEMGATWCKPCAAAIPKLTQLAKEYKDRVEVVGLFVQEINREPLDTPNPKYVEKVKEYVAKKGKEMVYNVGVDDPQKNLERTWINAYGASRGVPQTFVIDQQGRLAAHFRGLDEVQLKKTIDALLAGTYSIEKAVEKKKQENAVTIKYDHAKDLYVDGNGGDGSDFLFRSVLSKWPTEIDGVPVVGRPHPLYSVRPWLREPMESKDIDKSYYESRQGRIQAVATPLEMLYYAAYADTLANVVESRYPRTLQYESDSLTFIKKSYETHWHKPILEVLDSTPFKTHWRSPENRWNYVLNVPDKKKATGVYLQKLMREDLKRYFGYEVSVETREMSVYYLKARPQAKKMRSRSQNKKDFKGEKFNRGGVKGYTYTSADIRDIIARLSKELNTGYLYSRRNTIEERFIDATGIDYLIDFDMTLEEWNYFENHDMEGVKRFLARHGLYLEKGTKPMKAVVIRDRKQEILGPVFKD